jgi:hypothetical protein
VCGRASCSVQVLAQVAPQSSETSRLGDRLQFEWRKATSIVLKDNLLFQWRKVGGDKCERKEGSERMKVEKKVFCVRCQWTFSTST